MAERAASTFSFPGCVDGWCDGLAWPVSLPCAASVYCLVQSCLGMVATNPDPNPNSNPNTTPVRVCACACLCRSVGWPWSWCCCLISSCGGGLCGSWRLRTPSGDGLVWWCCDGLTHVLVWLLSCACFVVPVMWWWSSACCLGVGGVVFWRSSECMCCCDDASRFCDPSSMF
jgi:hypothetical protein